MKRFTLHKSERLKKRKAIDALFRQGKSFAVYPLRLYYRLSEGVAAEEALQAGVGVSKKHFRKAVDRNRIKRLTREAYRTQKHLVKELLPPGAGLQLFFIFTGKELPEFETIRKKVADALHRLQKEAGLTS